MSDEGFTGARNATQYLVDALLSKLGKRARKRLSDELAIASKRAEGPIGERDFVIGTFDQRHEARRLFEHQLKTFVFAAQMSNLVQHGFAIQQWRAPVTANWTNRSNRINSRNLGERKARCTCQAAR